MDINKPNIEIAVNGTESPGSATRLTSKNDFDIILFFDVFDMLFNLLLDFVWDYFLHLITQGKFNSLRGA